MNNLDLKTLLAKLTPAWNFTKRYVHFMYFVLLAGICGFLIFQIHSLTQAEPSEDAVNDKLKTVQRPNVDQNALKQIQQLQDQNVDVRTLFENTRNNPFSE